MTTANEYGIGPDSDWSEPDALVSLHQFRQQIIFDMAAESVERDEILPLSVLLDRMANELGLDEDRYRVLAFAGMMIEYDRVLRSETPEERAIREGRIETLLDTLNDVTSDFGGFEGFMNHCAEEISAQKGEVEMLNEMFGFTEE